MKDLLTPLNIPNEEDEAERDLVRSRSLVSKQVVKTKNHIQSLLRGMELIIGMKKKLSIFGLISIENGFMEKHPL